MPTWVNVRFHKIHVHKSENYDRGLLGLEGEPGESAEWRLKFTVSDASQDEKASRSWERDGVRDNTEYPLNFDFEVALPADGLRITIFGKELDDSSGNDWLPRIERTHSPEPGWKTGQRYKGSSAVHHSNFSYEVEYTIKFAQSTVITPGTGHLVDIGYSVLWNASTAKQRWLLDCSEQELRKKADEIWEQGGRFLQMQAYVVNGEVRYNCLWNFSGIGQVWNPNCDEAHFRRTTDELWKWARPAQVQAFVVGKEVRYSCLWNAGTHDQVRNPNCTEAHFRKRTDELWKWARLAQVQAFVVGKELRYACLWNAGKHGQIWDPNCTAAHLNKTTGELWSWARPAQVQAFRFGNEIRYSCLWNAGAHGQVWSSNCDEQHVHKTTDELKSWARPVYVYAFVR